MHYQSHLLVQWMHRYDLFKVVEHGVTGFGVWEIGDIADTGPRCDGNEDDTDQDGTTYTIHGQDYHDNKTKNTHPSSRTLHSMACTNAIGILVLIGACSYSTTIDELYVTSQMVSNAYQEQQAWICRGQQYRYRPRIASQWSRGRGRYRIPWQPWYS